MAVGTRARRRILGVSGALLLASSAVTAAPQPVHATSDAPAKGAWNWCTDSVRNGCLEAVTTVSPSGASTTYTDASQLPSGLTVSATCSMNGGKGSTCDGNKYQTTANNTCVQKADWTGGFTVPSVEVDVVWPGRTGWSITARFSTGDYQPAFLIGHGTTRTRTSDDGDGTFTFELTSVIETTYMGSTTSSDNKTIATSEKESVHVQLWPRDHLIKVNSTSVPRPCDWYPFVGAWAEANAQGFSWSYSSASSTVSTGPGTPGTPTTLKFMASAPHYKPRNGSDPLEENPARVQVFLPTSYFRALGYATLDEFDTSSYSVTTEDGQKTKPTVTRRDDGLLINLGLSHYSSPNPSITFKVKGYALPSPSSLPLTVPVIGTASKGTSSGSSTGTPSGTKSGKSKGPATVRMRRSSTKPLWALIRYTGSGKRTYRITGACTISNMKLVTPKRATVCTVTLSVRNQAGRVVTTKKVIVKVA